MTANLPALPVPIAPARTSQATLIEQTRAVAEVQAAVMVAQANRRDVLGAYAAMRNACNRLYLAEQAFFKVVNRGEGPSIHLARELARIWGNLDNGVRELRRGEDESEVLAYAWDQEANVRNSRSFIVPHQRMVKDAAGRQVRKDLVDLQDVYLNNQNIGARALRECIFAMLPSEFVNEAIDLCRATVKRGDGLPLEKRIENMLSHYAGIGVKARQIEQRLGRSKGQWTAADVAELAIIHTSINRGDTTAGNEFPVETITVAELHTQATPAPAPQTPPAPAEPPRIPEPAATSPEDKSTPLPAASGTRQRSRGTAGRTSVDPVLDDEADPRDEWPPTPTIPGTEPS